MKATENKKIYRFIIGALMAALLFTSLFFLFTASADAPTYTLENGVLTVYTMPLGDRASDYPWYPERSLVRKAVLKEGAGRLSASAFEGYPSLEEIIFPGGNNSIGDQALASCPSLFRIYFRAPVTSIGRAAFLGSKNIRVIVLTDQTKHDLEVLAALSPYNLAVNGGVETGLDTAVYVTFSTFNPGWYNDPSELTLAGRLTAAADTNRDGGVTIQDTTSLLDRLSGPDLDWTGRLDDVDGNGATSITDLTALLNYLAGACVHRPERLASREATCAEAGYEEYCRCADCGVELTVKREIAKKDHTVQYINAVAPGCTTDGHTDGRICSVCGEILKEQTVLPSLGHDAAMIAGAAPTCTDSGLSEGSYCTRCGVTLAEQTTLPPLGHLPTVIAALPATCTVPGLTEGSECARCGAVLVPQQITSPLGHTPQTLLAVPATCTAFGLTEGSKCSVCGALLEAQTALPMLGHDFVDGVCTRCGEIEGVGDRFEIIRFGSYEQDNDLSNGSEEIEWIVLEKKDGKALLLSKYALEMKHYTTNYAFSWQSSTLRSWLNDDFYNAAFTDEEKSRIQLSSIYTEYSTDDRVFLLDLDDVTNPDYGFNADPHAQDSVRICHPTAYAVRDVDQPSGKCAWWLRTESDDGPLLVAYQMIAANNGSCASTQAREDTCGVRPAIWIDIVCTHDIVADKAVAPTCTKTGLSAGSHCSLCGEVFEEQTVLPALGHTPQILAARPPTCTAAGKTEGSKCGVCGVKLQAQQTVPALGHDPETLPAVPAACLTEGLSEGSVCSRCSLVLLQQSSIPATGHIFVGTSCASCSLTPPLSYGLEFTLNAAGDAYTVTGTGACYKDAIVSIPQEYNGLPVTAIGDYAFDDDYPYHLQYALIPEGVRTIGAYAFGYCGHMIGITIPLSVEYIGEYAFTDTVRLQNVCYNGTIEDFVRKSCLCSFFTNSNGQKKLYCQGELITDVIFPADMEEIPAGLFSRCNCFKTFVVPEGVASIGDSAFCFCSADFLYLPSTVTYIGAYAILGAANQIIYSGTREEWDRIHIVNDLYISANVVFAGEQEQTNNEP